VGIRDREHLLSVVSGRSDRRIALFKEPIHSKFGVIFSTPLHRFFHRLKVEHKVRSQGERRFDRNASYREGQVFWNPSSKQNGTWSG
jgi:hypothetical protein